MASDIDVQKQNQINQINNDISRLENAKGRISQFQSEMFGEVFKFNKYPDEFGGEWCGKVYQKVYEKVENFAQQGTALSDSITIITGEINSVIQQLQNKKSGL